MEDVRHFGRPLEELFRSADFGRPNLAANLLATFPFVGNSHQVRGWVSSSERHPGIQRSPAAKPIKTGIRRYSMQVKTVSTNLVVSAIGGTDAVEAKPFRQSKNFVIKGFMRTQRKRKNIE